MPEQSQHTQMHIIRSGDQFKHKMNPQLRLRQKAREAFPADSVGMAVKGLWPRLHGEDETPQLTLCSVEARKRPCQAGLSMTMFILTTRLALTFQIFLYYNGSCYK